MRSLPAAKRRRAVICEDMAKRRQAATLSRAYRQHDGITRACVGSCDKHQAARQRRAAAARINANAYSVHAARCDVGRCTMSLGTHLIKTRADGR